MLNKEFMQGILLDICLMMAGYYAVRMSHNIAVAYFVGYFLGGLIVMFGVILLFGRK